MARIFEDSMEGNCPWCNEVISINGLIGINTNQCPKCANPVFIRAFKDIGIGEVFIDKQFGGKWAKFAEDKVVCVEDDSTYRIGKIVDTSAFTLDPDDHMYPY